MMSKLSNTGLYLLTTCFCYGYFGNSCELAVSIILPEERHDLVNLVGAPQNGLGDIKLGSLGKVGSNHYRTEKFYVNKTTGVYDFNFSIDSDLSSKSVPVRVYLTDCHITHVDVSPKDFNSKYFVTSITDERLFTNYYSKFLLILLTEKESTGALS